MITITVILLIKDGEDYMKYLSKYFNVIETNYKSKYQFEYLFYENNSNDETRKCIQTFLENRTGKYWSEDLSINKDMSGIKPERGIYMRFLRNRLKEYHGKLSSDFTWLIDCDVLFPMNIVEHLINKFDNYRLKVGASTENNVIVDLPVESNSVDSIPVNSEYTKYNDRFDIMIKNDSQISIKRLDSEGGWGQQLDLMVQPRHTMSAVTPFDMCYDSYVNNDKNMNHYYDSLAFITADNISYLNNDNTCMFSTCDRCENHRRVFNIDVDSRHLLKRNQIASVNSAFGGCFLIKTEVYNQVDWGNEESTEVCEHHSLCKKIREFGEIVIDPTISVVTTIPTLRDYSYIHTELFSQS